MLIANRMTNDATSMVSRPKRTATSTIAASLAGIPTIVAATKWDAVKASQRVRQLRALAAEFEDSERPLLPVSSETGENLPTLGRLLKDRLTGRTREGAAPAAPQGPTQKES